MYPIFRLFFSVISASLKPKMAMTETAEISYYCRPWDIDMFMEMNNGRIITLYDLGRFDLAIRCGLMAILRKNNWGLVVAGSTLRYRNRVRMFDKVVMRSRLAYVDEKWFYIEQSNWVKGVATSSAIFRTAITKKGKMIPSEQVVQAMDISYENLAASKWLKKWIDSESCRTWPPE